MVTVAFLSGSVLSLALFAPVWAAARGGLVGGGVSLNGCKLRSKNDLRLPLHTTSQMHQPFLEYRGQLASPDGKTKWGWSMLIDRCGATPKVALVSGGIPGFSCPAGGAFYGYNSVLISFLGHELAIQDRRFSASGLAVGQGNPDAYSLTGTVTGSVTIPKRGPGRGSSTITGKVTDDSFCPGSPMTYKVTFARTWGYV